MPSLTLADLLGGQQGNPVQTAGTGDPGYEQRKQGWVQSLNQMVKDPVNAMTLMQIGNSMQNIQPGQNAATQFTNALSEGLNYRQRYQHVMEQRRMQGRKEEREDRRVGFEGARVEQGQERINLDQRKADNEATYKGAQLGLSEERNKIEREKIRALEARGAGVGGGKPSDKDKLAAAIASRFSVPADEARIIAESYGSRAALITKYTEAARQADEENAAMLGTPSAFNELETRKRIAATVDAAMGLSPGTLSSEERPAPESEFQALYKSLSPEQKAAYDKRAETDPEFGTWWNTNKASLK